MPARSSRRQPISRLSRHLALIAAVGALSACGSTAQHSATKLPAVGPSACKLTTRTKAQLAKAQADLVKLRAVAATQGKYTEMGTAAMQVATGRYSDDLVDSQLDPFRVNRLIDLGASVASAYCGICFQMLEANRPIPEMKYEPQQC